MLNSGERQVSPTIDGIRRDHVARYEWAAKTLPAGSRVIDAACGIGYGARILAEAGHKVTAVDINDEAIAYGQAHYSHPNVTFVRGDLTNWRHDLEQVCDAVVSFETIEHLHDPLSMLRAFRKIAPVLLASVPNEEKFPFRGYRFHHRHYTPSQFVSLLNAAGFQVDMMLGQEGPYSEVEPGMNGRTVIAAASRGEEKAIAAAPHHVAIVALGPSAKEYFELAKNLGGGNAVADEIWAINAMGGIIACDRIFHMDDVLVQERRAAERPNSNIAGMLGWLKKHPGPIYTSAVRQGYPGLVPFPLEDVLNNGGVPYLNNTAAYAIAFARHIGVKKLSLFGIDFTYFNQHHGERGRGCCEFWLGLCTADGMEIVLPEQTALMDACAPPDELMYGYDGFDVILHDAPENKLRVEMRPKELPTAAEIEARYDHSQPTNRLIARPQNAESKVPA